MDATKTKRKRRRNRKATRRAMTPAQQFDADVASGRAMTHHREGRRYRATKKCCSANWADAHWHGQLHIGLAEVWHTPVEYPPGSDQTGMIQCRQCGRFTPPNCIVQHTGTPMCLDCAIAGVKSPPEMSSHTVISESRAKWCHRRGKSYDGLY
jgi:hypothetical protein